METIALDEFKPTNTNKHHTNAHNSTNNLLHNTTNTHNNYTYNTNKHNTNYAVDNDSTVEMGDLNGVQESGRKLKKLRRATEKSIYYLTYYLFCYISLLIYFIKNNYYIIPNLIKMLLKRIYSKDNNSDIFKMSNQLKHDIYSGPIL